MGRLRRRSFADPSSIGGEVGWKAGTGCSSTSSGSSTRCQLSSAGRWMRGPASPCKPGGFVVPPPGSWSGPLVGGRGGVGAQFQRGCPQCCSTRRLERAQTAVWRRSCWCQAPQESDSLARDLPSWPSPPSSLPSSPPSPPPSFPRTASPNPPSPHQDKPPSPAAASACC